MANRNNNNSQDLMLKKQTEDAIELGTLQLDEVLGDVLDDLGVDDVLGTLDDDDGGDMQDSDEDEQSNATATNTAAGRDAGENAYAPGRGLHGATSVPTYTGGAQSTSTYQYDEQPGEEDEKRKDVAAMDQMIDDLDIDDVEQYEEDDEEEDSKRMLRGYTYRRNLELTPQQREERLNTQDEACMMLLAPDYFKIENKVQRREMLRQKNSAVHGWTAQDLDDTVVNVAESMAEGSGVDMYDTQMFDTKDRKKRDLYMLREVDLSQVKGIPPKYFRGKGNQGDDDDLALTPNDGDGSDNEVDEFDTIDLEDVLDVRESTVGGMSSGVANTLKKFGNKVSGRSGGSKIVCAGCGLKLKFRSKHRDRDNYVAFHCEKTNKFYVFHDHVCVQLRKIKEAIRTFVFEKDREPDDPDVESHFINIDVDEHMKFNQRNRPRHFTTPKQGDFNYKDDGDNYEDSESSKVENQTSSQAAHSFNIFGSGNNKGKQSPIKHPSFRRYRMQVETIMRRLARVRKIDDQKGPLYKDRFGDLPKILLFSDLSEFGIPVWEFVSDALKSKHRPALWLVLRFLALEMPTNSVLDLLKRHTHLLSKHMLREYDEVCKSTMEGAKHPIATTLRLSAFMYERARLDPSNKDAYEKVGIQYTKISRKLLKEIESDHLFAMLLQMPSDLNGLSIVEIALKHSLTDFLEDPRIVRVFGVMWAGGYDFLEPSSNFQDSDISYAELYVRLMKDPGRFYFSPAGKFYSSSVLYLLFLFFVSYVTVIPIYYYELEEYPLEYAMWGCAFGFVMHEVLELADSPAEYFSIGTNFWDVFLSINWIVLFIWRFFVTKDRRFDEVTGELDPVATRNTFTCHVYMLLWAAQCILLWSRVASLLQTSKKAGALIRMILKMMEDITNFGLICGVFFIGVGFALYYIIGNDLEQKENLGSIGSVFNFTFRTLIGQPEWDRLTKDCDDDGYCRFDNVRSNMAIGFIILFSIFGTILLLNLLIAMMAHSYESIERKSNMELNKQRINTTYELDRSRGTIAPPLNLIAYLMYVYWVAFEAMAWVLTFGHRQFNEEFCSPLNRDAKHYQEGDHVKFVKAGRKITGVVTKRTTILDRLAGNTQLMDRRRGSTVDGAGQDGVVIWDLQVKYAKKMYDLRDKDVLKVKKPFFKRRKHRIPTLEIENIYCRFCRFNISKENMDIQYYLNLFEQRGQHIDPDDKEFMKSLLASSEEEYNIPNPRQCELCPNCYRPFKVSKDGTRDVLLRRSFVLEIVSYFAFRVIVWPLLVLIMFGPASIGSVKDFVNKRILKASDDEEASQETEAKAKIVMNRSESNDDYRATVRRVSKQEEGTKEMMKRIDNNVQRLEKEILGKNEDEYEPEDEEEENEINAFRADEFNKRVDKMRREMHDRFNEMRRLLEESGIAGGHD